MPAVIVSGFSIMQIAYHTARKVNKFCETNFVNLELHIPILRGKALFLLLGLILLLRVLYHRPQHRPLVILVFRVN
jgi:hypothetical protein